jgi:hypothetical protein
VIISGELCATIRNAGLKGVEFKPVAKDVSEVTSPLPWPTG